MPPWIVFQNFKLLKPVSFLPTYRHQNHPHYKRNETIQFNVRVLSSIDMKERRKSEKIKSKKVPASLAPTSLSSGVNGTSGSRISRAPFVARQRGSAVEGYPGVYMLHEYLDLWWKQFRGFGCEADMCGGQICARSYARLGDVLRVRATGHKDEYDAVCATLEGVKPQ